jgi:hypothetical protein
LDFLGDYNLDKAEDEMGYESGQAGALVELVLGPRAAEFASTGQHPVFPPEAVCGFVKVIIAISFSGSSIFRELRRPPGAFFLSAKFGALRSK